MRALLSRLRYSRVAQAAIAVVGALSMLLVLVSPAQARWTKPRTLTLSGWLPRDFPLVAADRKGDSVLVWTACNNNAPTCGNQIQARIRFRGGRLGRVKTLSPPELPQSFPQVAVDDAGDSAVVWENGNSQVRGRRMSAAGSLGRLRALTPSGASADNATVVMSPKGRALVAWLEYRWQSGGYSWKARFFYKNGTLGKVMNLGPARPDVPALGIDRRGTAIFAWSDPGTGLVARRIKPGHLSPLRVIMPAASGNEYWMPSVTADRDGDAVVWSLGRTSNGSGPLHLWARRLSRTGRLGPVRHISSRTSNVTAHPLVVANDYAVATDLAGASMAVWSQWTDAAQTRTAVFGRRLSRTGSLSPITRLGPGDLPAVTMADDGHGLAVWQSLPDSKQVTTAYGRRFARSGKFRSRVQLAPDGVRVKAASSPQGRFSVMWIQTSKPWPIRARFGP